jgi:hypothetical protein
MSELDTWLDKLSIDELEETIKQLVKSYDRNPLPEVDEVVQRVRKKLNER